MVSVTLPEDVSMKLSEIVSIIIFFLLFRFYGFSSLFH